MRTVTRLLARVDDAIEHRFISGSRAVGAARTLIAVAQLSILVLTPFDAMFVPVGQWQPLVGCGSWLGQTSIFCWAPPQWAVGVLVVGLLATATGILPRYLSWVHLYCSISIGSVIDLPDGGDHVAMVACFWIAVATLDDRRTWHWQAPPASSRVSSWRGVAWAGHWGLRLQIAYVYLHSGLAKLAVESWQEGTATYYVVRMEFFGASGPIGELARWLTSIPLVALMTSWGTIAVEVALAVLLLLRAPYQRVALALAVVLHLSILVVLGLFSFGLVMIGSVLAATAWGVESWRGTRRRTPVPTDARPAPESGSAVPGQQSMDVLR